MDHILPSPSWFQSLSLKKDTRGKSSRVLIVRFWRRTIMYLQVPNISVMTSSGLIPAGCPYYMNGKGLVVVVVK
jgi:hypothetical protein